jgi:hypothetical protein
MSSLANFLNKASHMAYSSNGSPDKAATFLAGKINGKGKMKMA